MPNVSITVVNWNCHADTIKCVKSLLAQTIAIDIIIVDNHSSSHSIRALESFCSDKPNISLLKNSENKGFSGGVNTGFNGALSADYDYIGTLNPDAIAEPDWAKLLIQSFADDDTIGTSTGLLLEGSGKQIDSAGESFSSWGVSFPRFRGAKATKQLTPEYVFGSTGGAVIYTRKLLETIGLYDEDFFMYYEDADMNFRAQLAGFKTFFNPDAVARHSTGSSSKKVNGLVVTQAFKNLPQVIIKNTPNELLASMFLKFSVLYILYFIKSIPRGDVRYSVKGMYQAMALVPSALQKRKRIQAQKSVSARYIKSLMAPGLPPRK